MTNIEISKQNDGISTSWCLFLIFITLKLTGNIAWSWWWVTVPLWGPPLVLLGLVTVAVIVAWLASLFGVSADKLFRRKKR